MMIQTEDFLRVKKLKTSVGAKTRVVSVKRLTNSYVICPALFQGTLTTIETGVFLFSAESRRVGAVSFSDACPTHDTNTGMPEGIANQLTTLAVLPVAVIPTSTFSAWWTWVIPV